MADAEDIGADSSHSANGTSSSSTRGSRMRDGDENFLLAVGWTELIYEEPFPIFSNEILQTLDLRKKESILSDMPHFDINWDSVVTSNVPFKPPNHLMASPDYTTVLSNIRAF
jgi:hypothetical protein